MPQLSEAYLQVAPGRTVSLTKFRHKERCGGTADHCHDANFVVTSGTVCSYDDNLRGHQWQHNQAGKNPRFDID